MLLGHSSSYIPTTRFLNTAILQLLISKHSNFTLGCQLMLIRVKLPSLKYPFWGLSPLRFLIAFALIWNILPLGYAPVHPNFTIYCFYQLSDNFFFCFHRHSVAYFDVPVYPTTNIFIYFTVCMCSFHVYFLEDDLPQFIFFTHKEMSWTLSLILIYLYPYLSELLKEIVHAYKNS